MNSQPVVALERQTARQPFVFYILGYANDKAVNAGQIMWHPLSALAVCDAWATCRFHLSSANPRRN